MVGKNNHEVKRDKTTEQVHKYSIRKFKNGIASAAIGTLLLGAVANVDAVSADEGNAEGADTEVTAIAPAQAATPDAPVHEVYPPIASTVTLEFGDSVTADKLINAVSFGEAYPSNIDAPVVTVPGTADRKSVV